MFNSSLIRASKTLFCSVDYTIGKVKFEYEYETNKLLEIV